MIEISKLLSPETARMLPFWLIALALIVIAVRGSISFDINRWTEKRRENLILKIRGLRPHVEIDEVNGQYRIISTYISPFGSLAHQCQRCGDVTHDWNYPERSATYWASNPDLLLKRLKKLEKLNAKL